MRVRMFFDLKVDIYKWAEEFGIEGHPGLAEYVHASVRLHVRNLVESHLRERGVLK